MIKFILSLSFMLSGSTIFAQEEEVESSDYDRGFFVGNVISDTSSFGKEGGVYDYGLASVLESTYKIEIRFTSHCFRGFQSTVLYYDTKWNVKTCQYQYQSGEKDKNWISVQNDHLDSLFAVLAVNDIFGLPNDNNLSFGKNYFNPETGNLSGEGIGVGCGSYYIIEFKIADQYRRYDFSNPEVFAEFYPNVQEFRNYSEIVRVFTELVKR
ncbi:hypothetical protein [Fluviicola sp.]|uniref:hypothetical protein n=1 Tax=Fluviicola sp. TaxID=1917219 RepID=UPI0031D1244F